MRPKSAVGLGFTNTRVMNKCLLAKWIYKIENEVNTILCKLLRRKYLSGKSIFSCKARVASQFWRGLLEIRDCCAMGMIYLLGGGRKARFWWDVWLGDYPFKNRFSNLFQICH
jgi:hypothetical protein